MTRSKGAVQATGITLLLIIPFTGISCAPPAILLERIAIYIGRFLVNTLVGETIDVAMSTLFSKPTKNEKVDPQVKVDAYDPLRGTFQGTMRFKHEASGKEYELTNPRVVRPTVNEKWQLSPDYLQGVLDALKKPQ